jgi:hypothetical protein
MVCSISDLAKFIDDDDFTIGPLRSMLPEWLRIHGSR